MVRNWDKMLKEMEETFEVEVNISEKGLAHLAVTCNGNQWTTMRFPASRIPEVMFELLKEATRQKVEVPNDVHQWSETVEMWARAQETSEVWMEKASAAESALSALKNQVVDLQRFAVQVLNPDQTPLDVLTELIEKLKEM